MLRILMVIFVVLFFCGFFLFMVMIVILYFGIFFVFNIVLCWIDIILEELFMLNWFDFLEKMKYDILLFGDVLLVL